MSSTAGSRGAQWAVYLHRCAGGDQNALASLYDESCQLVFTVVYRILRNPADAEEVTSDVYRQAWRDAARFTPARGSAPGWLIVLARSRAMDRRRQSRARHRMGGVMAEISVEIRDERPGPETEAVERQRGRVVAGALRLLPQAQREAIELAFYQGLSHGEIAERLSTPLGTIKTRIRIGMSKLRDLLKEGL